MGTQPEIDDSNPRRPPRRLGCWVLLIFVLFTALGISLAWMSRVRIADNIIADELARRGIQASYEIENIGGRHQALRNVVAGNPRQPDFTVDRVEVDISYGFGIPRIGRLRLVRPRLFGIYRNGRLSFGALDPLIFTKEERPFELPELNLEIVDGRGLIEGDLGPAAFKLDGGGYLPDGFRGEIGAILPRLPVHGCSPMRATAYGRVTIGSRQPGFEGPVRIGATECSPSSVEFGGGGFQVNAKADRQLQVFDGNIGIDLKALQLAGVRLQGGAKGTTRFTWRDGNLTARYDLEGSGLHTDQATGKRLRVDGSLRTRNDFSRIELEGHVDGSDISLGAGLDTLLADAADATDSTLLGPMMAQIRSRLNDEGKASRLSADYTLRLMGDRLSLVAPSMYLRGRSGATLLSVSRLEFARTGQATPQIAGNFATGGDGLPKIAGRVEQDGGGAMHLQLAMADYQVGSSRLAVPALQVKQGSAGAFAFSGSAIASGALPGGEARNLVIPIEGNWTTPGGFSMWTRCTDLRFDGLKLANLVLGRHRLTLCPSRGNPILNIGDRGFRLAAGTDALLLSGQLGTTPITIRSGPAGFAYPGAVSVKQMQVSLGPAATASHFAISDLSANVGKEIAGTFEGADIRLSAVPIDMIGAEGAWGYKGGALAINGARFTLVDRDKPARFEPLAAQDARLELVDNQIEAKASLREPKSGRQVASTTIVHDLTSGRGHANLSVTGLTFDESLQPTNLTYLAEGVVALVDGTVAGSGRIDWNPEGVSSSGTFSTEALDFAAAFGPVKGVSGRIVFTDLLGLTTAPGQHLEISSINPGIEVNDGDVQFRLAGGELLSIEAATWPFMGGTLRLQPLDIHFGVAEPRRYVLDIEGLDAGRFVERMELNNMSATGTFDGEVPLVFDVQGNGSVEAGLLTSRPPGGNVSYIGELTYEDLGTIANFAFDALRSLDYRQMHIQMDGSLTGEIVTKVRLDGVSQGAGAEKNLVTNAIAGLPIRVDVNIRAPFYQLIGSTRALYDPAAIRDPRTLGLVDDRGKAIRSETDGNPAPTVPNDKTDNEAAIQRRESEEMP